MAVRFLGLLPPIFLGVVLGGLIGWIVTGDWIYAIVWGVGLAPAILISLFLTMRRMGVTGVKSGGYAAGRVESVQRAGETASGEQQVDVRVSVFSQDDSPYQTTMRTVVGDAAAKRALSAGAFVPLLRLGPLRRPEVSYAPAAPPEWMEQVAKLKSEAATLPAAGDVKPWETATTTTPGTPKPGTVKPGRGGALGIVLVLAAAALVLIPAYPSIARGVNNIVQGEWDGSDMVTGLYQQESVDQMVAAAGTSEFTNLGFYPTYILGDALSRSGPDRTDAVQWQYGRAWVDGPSYSQSTELAAGAVRRERARHLDGGAGRAGRGRAQRHPGPRVRVRLRARRLRDRRAGDHDQHHAARTRTATSSTPSTAS